MMPLSLEDAASSAPKGFFEQPVITGTGKTEVFMGGNEEGTKGRRTLQ